MEKKKKHRADLHSHGLLGFSEKCLAIQKYGGKNILQLIGDSCFNKGIDICAITSINVEIPKGSIYDRFGCLINYISSLPKEYDAEVMWENIIALRKQNQLLYILNGQEVEVKENGKIVHHLVVGTNQVPSFMPIYDTISYGKDKGLIQISDHPFSLSHWGIGKKLLEKYLNKYDAIEGFNSQMALPSFLCCIPYIKDFTKQINAKAIKFAENNNCPWIATSDSHRIEDIGISYIEFENNINDKNEETILDSLKSIVCSGDFTNHCNYENLFSWINWVSRGFFVEDRVK